jgi:predicted helicase
MAGQSQKIDHYEIFKEYWKQLSKIADAERTELTDRPTLQQLIGKIAPQDTRVIHEASTDKNQGEKNYGTPDFRVNKSGMTVGYIETKKIDAIIDSYIDSEQIKKYSQLSPNILLTNYVDFIWLKNGKVVGKASLGAIYNKDKTLISRDKAEEVENLLGKFLSTYPARIESVEALTTILAPRTRFLKDYFYKNTTPENDNVYGLFQSFRKRVFKNFEVEEFADVFAQMVVYGLFLAKLKNDTSTKLDIDNAKKYIPHSFGLIRELVRYLDKIEEEHEREIKWLLDEIIEILNNADIEAISNELSFSQYKARNAGQGKIKTQDPYIYFYEHFLEKYNPKLKRQMGVYYTPLPIVNFIVRNVQNILKDKFDIKDGFASKNVTTLDFATGTGTFLAEIFQLVLGTLPEDSGKKDHIIKQHLLQNFFGFEYMMAPYTIAHLKLSELLKESGYELEDDERLGVYLTNTLEYLGERGQQLTDLKALDREGEKSQEVKDKDILVIMGNPPYSGISRNRGPFITDIIQDYKYVSNEPLNERKHWLNDDYVKFIRFAQWKMDNVSEGVVGIITNHSFLDNPTFRGMRDSLLQSFDQIYTINLHGNSKKKEKAPDASKDENVFDIQQGTCITFFIKKPDIQKGVYYTDWWGMRESKFENCLKLNSGDIGWQKLEPEYPYYYFIPFANKLALEYEKFWSVKTIFQNQVTGIVTARDKIAISFSKYRLQQIINEFSNYNITHNEVREKYKIKNTRGWKLENIRPKLFKNNNLKNNIKNICYRPFDNRFIIYDINLVDWGRWELMQHMLAGDNLGLVTMKGSIGNNFNHALVTNNIIDCNIYGFRTSLFPLYLYKNEGQLNLFSDSLHTKDAEKIENFSTEFREWLDKYYNHHFTPEEVLGYIYGVLYSQTYRDKYLEFLKQDFPRVPYPESDELFKEMSDLGWELIEVHLMNKLPDRGLGSYIGGGSDTVEKISYDAENERIYINKHKYFDQVPGEVWEFYIGGYQVLSKYLKSRKNRELSFEEIENVENIINILSFTIDKMKNIDEIYKKIDE